MNPTPFGKYLLLEKIGTGGMAELLLAKQEGMKGFEKILAIKRILPHLTQDNEFVSMFINEAKLAAILSHQNIVQIFDLGSVVPPGQQDPNFYIAMEYIQGKDLRSVISAAKNRGSGLPMDHALSIMSKVCCGLDYAHRKKDAQGTDLNIVHRDISPQNILISFEGDVKIVDFGIAKAVSQGSETRTGLLKGKLAYMSPEQAWGKPVDRRTDIFAMGIVLYEMLTGERLFKGENEMSTLEKVREAKVSPVTQINPQVDRELNDILLKALAKDPNDRFQTASEMALALEHLISKNGYAFSSLSLSNYMGNLFQFEIEEETKRIQLVAGSNDLLPSSRPPSTDMKGKSMESSPIPSSPGEIKRPPGTGRLPKSGPIQSGVENRRPVSPAVSQRPLTQEINSSVAVPAKKTVWPRRKWALEKAGKRKRGKPHPVLRSVFLSVILLCVAWVALFMVRPHWVEQTASRIPWLSFIQNEWVQLSMKVRAVGAPPPETAPPTPQPNAEPATHKDSEQELIATVSLPDPPVSELNTKPPLPQAPPPILDQEAFTPMEETEDPHPSPSTDSLPPSPSQKRLVQNLFQEAKVAYNNGELEEVEKKIRQIIDISPNHPRAYHLLGTLYLHREDDETALRIFSEASSTFPDNPQLHYDLGFLYFKKNLYTLTRDEFSKALALDPNLPPSKRARQILEEIGGPS